MRTKDTSAKVAKKDKRAKELRDRGNLLLARCLTDYKPDENVPPEAGPHAKDLHTKDVFVKVAKDLLDADLPIKDVLEKDAKELPDPDLPRNTCLREM